MIGQNVMVPDIASQPPAPGRPVPPPPAVSPSTREDLRAVMAARRDLGPEYEDALVDSFLDKLDVEIAARVRNEVAAHMQQRPQVPGAPGRQKDNGVAVALGSLGIGIPLTTIAGAAAHFPGLLLAWGGIIAVNVAYALGRRNQR